MREKRRIDKYLSEIDNFKRNMTSLDESKILVVYGEEEYLRYTAKKELQSFFSKRQIEYYCLEDSSTDSCDWEQLFSQKSLFEESSAYFVNKNESSTKFLPQISKLKSSKGLQNIFIFLWEDKKISPQYKKELERLGAKFLLCPKPLFADRPCLPPKGSRPIEALAPIRRNARPACPSRTPRRLAAVSPRRRSCSWG